RAGGAPGGAQAVGPRGASDVRGAPRLLPGARGGGARMSVAIVGAGPGDPGLVTVKALELVRAAQILVYDRLVSEELVAEASHAIRIARDGLSQERVNEVLVRHGRRGRRVVRLKGGDPFVFGRGAEEVDALEAGLIAAGRSPAEPAAVASRLSLPDYELRFGTLGTIASIASGLSTPALVVVGDVVGLAAREPARMATRG